MNYGLNCNSIVVNLEPIVIILSNFTFDYVYETYYEIHAKIPL